MNDLRKVNSIQLYYLWRNLAVSLLSVAGTIVGTHMLPHFMAPAVSLFFCAGLYSLIWSNDTSEQPGCTIVAQTMFFSLLTYTFLNIIFVILNQFGMMDLPMELNFFNQPFMASLTLLPIIFIVTLLSICFKHHTPVCKRCISRFGEVHERGYYGYVTSKESGIQMKNLAILFLLLSVYVWWYYLSRYVDVNQNGRDWYVFVWIIVGLISLAEIYFIIRYYNLYLDFVEHDEIITPAEIHDMTAKTYLRFYVTCGEYVYINKHLVDRVSQRTDIFDSPFTTKKSVNGIPLTEVARIIKKMTGVNDGQLRFFYGRHLAGNKKVSVLRYFYFLNGDISDNQQLDIPGEWVHFSEVKKMYSKNPNKMGTNALNDLSRLFTIILTEKEFDENGNRKNPIRSYKSNLTLADVRNTQLNLQDDKWINIAHFNSDMKYFKFKKFLRNITGRKNRRTYQDDFDL